MPRCLLALVPASSMLAPALARTALGVGGGDPRHPLTLPVAPL